MIRIKKLLAPVIAGVLVAFLFIAAESLLLPEPLANSTPSPSTDIVGVGFHALSPTPKMTDNKQGGAEDSPQSSVSSRQPPVKHVSHAQGAGSEDNGGSKPSSTIPNRNSLKPGPRNDQRLTANKRLNRQTNNMNVLFIGVEKDKLLACSVFSINYSDKYQAGAVFLPTYATAPNYKYTFAQIYKEVGVEGLKQIIEKEMEIDIELYYKIERELLKQLDSYIDPIYVNGEKIELYNLFTMAVSPQDEEILGALVRELLKPGVFFIRLPKLLLDATKYITTNFKVTIPNLKFHYNNIVNLDSRNITKVVLPTQKKTIKGKSYREIAPYHMLNTIYEVTK